MPFANGQALMPLVVLGPSGSRYSMSLAASFTRLDGSLAALPSLKLAFAVRTCLPGETYQNLVCLDCPPGMRIGVHPSRCIHGSSQANTAPPSTLQGASSARLDGSRRSSDKTTARCVLWPASGLRRSVDLVLQDCPVGFYSSIFGRASPCSPCLPGTHAPATGRTGCDLCDAGEAVVSVRQLVHSPILVQAASLLSTRRRACRAPLAQRASVVRPAAIPAIVSQPALSRPVVHPAVCFSWHYQHRSWQPKLRQMVSCVTFPFNLTVWFKSCAARRVVIRIAR